MSVCSNNLEHCFAQIVFACKELTKLLTGQCPYSHNALLSLTEALLQSDSRDMNMETDCEMLTLNQRSHCLSNLALASTRVTHFINAQTSNSLNAERKEPVQIWISSSSNLTGKSAVHSELWYSQGPFTVARHLRARQSQAHPEILTYNEQF